MALTSFNDIRTGQPLPPFSEIALTNYVQKYRRLYQRDFATYQIEDIGPGVPGTRVNWFRRVASFYSEFMFGERPRVQVENGRALEVLEPTFLSLLPELQAALGDMIKFGEGLIATHPQNPDFFVRFERDQHFVVTNVRGQIEGDILYRVRDANLPDERAVHLNKLIDVYKYPVNAPATWEVYEYTGAARDGAGGGLGTLRLSETLPPRQGRQVITFASNRETTSMFEDMEDSVAEMSRTLSRLGFSIRRNLRPHLYAPAGSILTEDGNNVRIDEKGMIFPMDQGDTVPGYLQWDSRSETVEYYYMTLRSVMFNMVGLSELLFDASLFPGELSGEALKRLMMPFISKLAHYKSILTVAIEDSIMVWLANQQATNREVFDIAREDITVEWPYEELFANMNQPTPISRARVVQAPPQG